MKTHWTELYRLKLYVYFYRSTAWLFCYDDLDRSRHHCPGSYCRHCLCYCHHTMNSLQTDRNSHLSWFVHLSIHPFIHRVPILRRNLVTIWCVSDNDVVVSVFAIAVLVVVFLGQLLITRWLLQWQRNLIFFRTFHNWLLLSITNLGLGINGWQAFFLEEQIHCDVVIMNPLTLVTCSTDPTRFTEGDT